MQFSTYYKPIENPDTKICDRLMDDLLKSPQKILDKIKKNGTMDAIRRGIDEYKNTSPEEARKKLEREARRLSESNKDLES